MAPAPPQRNLTRELQRFLTAKRSPLAAYAPAIVRAGRKYGVDPRLLVAIAGAETSYATNPRAGRDITTGHNAWGWGPHIKFPSWEASIDTIARGLRKGYLDQGLTSVPAIGRKWAPLGAANDPNWLNTGWAGNVSAVMRQLGAEGAVGPAAIPFGRAPGSPAGSRGSPGSRRANREYARAQGEAQRALQQALMLSLGGGDIRQAWGQLTRGLTLFSQMQAQPQASPPRAQAVAPAAGSRAAPVQVPLKPGGGWGGSKSIADQFAQVGLSNGLQVISEKRDRQMTASGGVSDHWVGSTNAYAYDISNGSAPTGEMDRTAMQIIRSLGGTWDGKSAIVMNFHEGGYRIQILYRTNVGGNHFNHIHVGVRKE